MQGSQYSVKIYETRVDDEAEFMDFFDANHILFKDHLIVIKGSMSEKIKHYLEKKSFYYLNNFTLPKGRSRKAVEKEFRSEIMDSAISKQIAEEELAKLSNQLQNNLTVIDEIIRSGRELNIEGDLLLLNRVNGGATVKTTGTLIVTNIVDGSIRCDGNFMMLAASAKANIIFHGVEIENKLLGKQLNRVEVKNNDIVITPVSKKEISWV